MGAPPGYFVKELLPAPRLADGSLDVWRIYASVTSPHGRHYLQLVAKSGHILVNDAVKETGLSVKGRSHAEWLHSYAGFHEMEQEIRLNPQFAAKFLAELALPSAIVHATDVLASDAPVDRKNEASRLILNVATNQSSQQRRRVTKKTAEMAAEGGVEDTKKRFGLVGSA